MAQWDHARCGLEMTMPVYETFSERKRRMERGGKPVVYRQDQLPERFRVQVAHIWSGLSTIAYNRDYVWPRVHDVLARDLGVWFIWDKTEPPRERCINFLLHDQNVDNVLSIIEIAFLVIEDCPFPISAQDSLDGCYRGDQLPISTKRTWLSIPSASIDVRGFTIFACRGCGAGHIVASRRAVSRSTAGVHAGPRALPQRKQ